jgi:hypothetical protein
VLLKAPATVGGRYKGERGHLKVAATGKPIEHHSGEWRSHGNQSVQWVIQKTWLNFWGWRGSE